MGEVGPRSLEAALARSESALRDLWQIYAGTLTGIGPRTQPVTAYAAFALELQEAMFVLLKERLTGAAMTFARPIFESTCRAGWVLGCATDEQIEDLRTNDAFRFPQMKAMALSVDKHFSLPDIFTTSVENNWSMLNSYTHPGLRQLTARFTDLDLNPEYPEQHVVAALNGSIGWVVLLSILVLRTHGRPEDAQRIEREIMPVVLALPDDLPSTAGSQ